MKSPQPASSGPQYGAPASMPPLRRPSLIQSAPYYRRSPCSMTSNGSDHHSFLTRQACLNSAAASSLFDGRPVASSLCIAYATPCNDRVTWILKCVAAFCAGGPPQQYGALQQNQPPPMYQGGAPPAYGGGGPQGAPPAMYGAPQGGPPAHYGAPASQPHYGAPQQPQYGAPQQPPAGQSTVAALHSWSSVGLKGALKGAMKRIRALLAMRIPRPAQGSHPLCRRMLRVCARAQRL